MITAKRYHDISCGHRVVGHENKCRYLHGHNYRFHFEIISKDGLDHIGRVLDFGVIKSRLCVWLEEHYDHQTLIWEKDPKLRALQEIFEDSIVVTPFNPTAENIAQHFVENIAPELLQDTGCQLSKLELWETRKCSATYQLQK